MFFFSPGTFVLPVLLLLPPMLVLVDQHLGHHMSVGSFGIVSSLVSALPPELGSRYFCFEVNSFRKLGSFRSQHLGPCLGILILRIHHVGRERMTVDLHRLLWRVKFDSSYFDNPLNLLVEYPAIVRIMRNSVMPHAIPMILQLNSQQNHMIRRQFDLPLFKQQIKNFVCLCNIELVLLLFLFSKWAWKWLSFLGPLSEANLYLLIGVRRISFKIYPFLD